MYDCEELQRWLEEEYIPWYEAQTAPAAPNAGPGDSGNNGPPPPPPRGGGG